MLEDLFKELGLPKSSEIIFNRLLRNGPSSARQLAENLSIPRPSIYDNLKILIKNGLVIEKEEENKKIFGVDDLAHLPQLIQSKVNNLLTGKKKIEEMLPELLKQHQSIEPKIRFYSGTDGVRQVLKDMTWHENIKAIGMWPMSEMIELLGADYMADITRRRVKNNISTRGIWPRNKMANLKKYPFMGSNKTLLREVRLAPKKMDWEMSHWVYEDKTAFISTANETFGFIVQSRDFANFMRAQFEVIWPLCSPITKTK